MKGDKIGETQGNRHTQMIYTWSGEVDIYKRGHTQRETHMKNDKYSAGQI